MRLFAFLILSTLQSFCLAQSCPAQQTPSDALGPFYVPDSPLSSNLAPQALLANPLKRLHVTGRVLSSTNCELGLANVTVEVWYAGEDAYQDYNYRGQVVTDSCGQYSFTQTFPSLYPSRPILHDHIRLSRNDEELLVTQMYFQGEEEGYVADADSRRMQVVQVSQNAEGVRSVEFNMYVDLEGDAACDGDGDTMDDAESSTETEKQTSNADTTSDTSHASLSRALVVLSVVSTCVWGAVI